MVVIIIYVFSCEYRELWSPHTSRGGWTGHTLLAPNTNVRPLCSLATSTYMVYGWCVCVLRSALYLYNYVSVLLWSLKCHDNKQVYVRASLCVLGLVLELEQWEYASISITFRWMPKCKENNNFFFALNNSTKNIEHWSLEFVITPNRIEYNRIAVQIMIAELVFIIDCSYSSIFVLNHSEWIVFLDQCTSWFEMDQSTVNHVDI